jgi:hypothetical protein
VFVVGTSITESDFACESGVGEDLECAIHGSLADSRVFF